MDINTTAKISANEFPILRHGHYANHAAISPWPKVTSQAIVDFARENSSIGPEKYAHWLRRESQLRQILAEFINAKGPEDIALLKNTTEGINTVARGIDWHSGDNIVLPADEFPSNRLPWLALEKKGVEIREVNIRSGSNPERALVSKMDTSTRLLVTSAVQWTDGLRLSLEPLGAACKQFGSLFFVDAIQQMGALQMDVRACNIDFLAADGHKWMLAPEGIAVFYCRQAIRHSIKLLQRGWRMVDEPYRFQRQSWAPSDAASRFEAGSPNALGQAALHASVGLLRNIGLQRVETMILENSRILSVQLASIPGIELSGEFDTQRFSGIVSFKVPELDPAKVLQQLKQRHLICALRGDAIRLSPHFYQAGEPLQEMLNIIEDSI